MKAIYITAIALTISTRVCGALEPPIIAGTSWTLTPLDTDFYVDKNCSNSHVTKSFKINGGLMTVGFDSNGRYALVSSGTTVSSGGYTYNPNYQCKLNGLICEGDIYLSPDAINIKLNSLNAYPQGASVLQFVRPYLSSSRNPKPVTGGESYVGTATNSNGNLKVHLSENRTYRFVADLIDPSCTITINLSFDGSGLPTPQ